MSDTETLLQTLSHDTAFAAAFPDGPPSHEVEALSGLEASGDRNAFLLSAMRLVARACNAHTRLIPQAAITVLPLRFVAIGSEVWLTEGTGSPARLEAINDRPVEALLQAARPFIPGPPFRQRALAPLLLAWPEALARLGVEDPPRYTLSTGPLTPDPARRVPALTLYPAREHGGLAATRDAPGLAEVQHLPRAVQVRLPEFHVPEPGVLEVALRNAANAALARPDAPLLIDIRGNPGGDFLKAETLLEALRSGWRGPRFVVLVDKFTFSAALVFACRALHRLPGTGRLMGEPMGDVTRFHAEGDLEVLPESGAALRWSDALHDWHSGTPHASTPPIIARHLVAAGTMVPHPTPFSTADELARGQDRARDAALAWAAGP
ncbi:hypothetical protein [Vannielia litorea]|uniref:Peptidase family S41 n=1 Tax=Vannielia litorea TaxID=1217970 RepID=A0A1N6HQH3_9RHOB|nr:hypothetical protein [Vannielia litorea]SIO21956.1 hypothetical protein SAMN05444002_3591 [Vannielia litorea]